MRMFTERCHCRTRRTAMVKNTENEVVWPHLDVFRFRKAFIGRSEKEKKKRQRGMMTMLKSGQKWTFQNILG